MYVLNQSWESDIPRTSSECDKVLNNLIIWWGCDTSSALTLTPQAKWSSAVSFKEKCKITKNKQQSISLVQNEIIIYAHSSWNKIGALCLKKGKLNLTIFLLWIKRWNWLVIGPFSWKKKKYAFAIIIIKLLLLAKHTKQNKRSAKNVQVRFGILIVMKKCFYWKVVID